MRVRAKLMNLTARLAMLERAVDALIGAADAHKREVSSLRELALLAETAHRQEVAALHEVVTMALKQVEALHELVIAERAPESSTVN